MATLRLGRVAAALRLWRARAARALLAVGSGSSVALPSARVMMSTALVAAAVVTSCAVVPLLAARVGVRVPLFDPRLSLGIRRGRGALPGAVVLDVVLGAVALRIVVRRSRSRLVRGGFSGARRGPVGRHLSLLRY